MIGCLRGNILEKQPPLVLIEVSGVGYEIHMPMTCFYELPDLNQEVMIFTHFLVREDAQLLFGFNSKQKRLLFRELIKVNGVGPKLALVILSSMSAQQFLIAVEKKEIAELVKVLGVGKKIAERLVIEMKDRFKGMHTDLFFSDASFTFTTLHTNNNIEAEAVSALVALGYKLQEASSMISKVAIPNANCETLIREALRATEVRNDRS